MTGTAPQAPQVPRTPRAAGPEGRTLARRIAGVADRKGAEEILILDLRKWPTLTDYFVVMNALSMPHVRALSETIEEAHPSVIRIERDGRDEWVLMDYGDVVVHIFQIEARRYYALERLWGDAPQVPIHAKVGKKKANSKSKAKKPKMKGKTKKKKA